MKKVVFFDLEGTLWNPSHELLRPAWDRLPAALRQLNISIPEGFDWSKMAGGTELEVVRKVVESTYPGMRWKKIQKWAKKIMSEMDNYYIIHGLNDIRDAVFGDVRQSLSDLKKMVGHWGL